MSCYALRLPKFFLSIHFAYCVYCRALPREALRKLDSSSSRLQNMSCGLLIATLKVLFLAIYLMCVFALLGSATGFSAIGHGVLDVLYIPLQLTGCRCIYSKLRHNGSDFRDMDLCSGILNASLGYFHTCSPVYVVLYYSI